MIVVSLLGMATGVWTEAREMQRKAMRRYTRPRLDAVEPSDSFEHSERSLPAYIACSQKASKTADVPRDPPRA